MKVTLYTSSSEKNRLDKSPYLERIGTISGVLRDSSSIINPVITFEIRDIMISDLKVVNDDEEIVQDDQSRNVVFDIVWKGFISKTNYAYIDAFERYYYITDIIAVSNELFEIHFKSDPLMTFKDQIRALKGYVTRNEFDFNRFIEDQNLTVYMNKAVTEYEPIPREGDEEDPSTVNTTLATGYPDLVTNGVLTTVTKYDLNYGNVVSSPADDLPTIRTDAFYSRGITASYVGRPDYISEALQQVSNFGHSNYLEFIKSFVAYPFNIPKTDTLTLIGFGDNLFSEASQETQTQYNFAHVNPSLSEYFIIADFYAPEPASFKDYPPSSVYEIYLPFYGWTELDINVCAGDDLIVYYTVNYQDGSGNVYLYDRTRNRLLFSSPCQIGVKLSWSVSNAEQLEAQKNALGLNLAVGLIGSAVSTGLGVVTGNPVAITGGILGGAKSITGYISSSSMLFPRAHATFAEALNGIYSPLKVKIRKTSRVYNSDDEEYSREFGKTLNQVRLLSSLNGYTRVGQIRLTGIPAFDSEIEEIEKDLADGVIL